MWAWITIAVAVGVLVFGLPVAYQIGAHNARAVQNGGELARQIVADEASSLRANAERPAPAGDAVAQQVGQAVLAEMARRMVSARPGVVDLDAARADRDKQIRS
jgi:hypothetical protein